MAYGRRSDDGWLVLLGLALLYVVPGLLVELAEDHGAWVWLAVLAGPIVGYKLYKRYEVFATSRRAQRKAVKPCHHGTVGAASDPSKCSACEVELTTQSEDAQRRRDEEKRQRLAANQVRFDEWKATVRTPEYLRGMDPQAFEKMCCLLFATMGYEVEETPYTGDGGVDGILRANGQLALLQCKRVRGSVGEPVLRDLYGTMISRRADQGIVITTGAVSRQARSWATGKPIRIIELEELTALVREHLGERSVVPEAFEAIAPDDHFMTCPECGRKLRKVKGRHGRFIGCSGYPDCRFTRRVRRR